MEITISEEKMRNIVREEIEGVLEEFLIRLRLEILPYVSKEEQEEIERLYAEDLIEEDERDIVVSRELEL
jgi:hypothetical protein